MTDGNRTDGRNFNDGPDPPRLIVPPYMGSRLPFFLPWVPKPAAGAADGLPSPPVLTESCGFKLIMGTVGGMAVSGLRIVLLLEVAAACTAVH